MSSYYSTLVLRTAVGLFILQVWLAIYGYNPLMRSQIRI